MEFLPGSLEIENNPIEREIWYLLYDLLKEKEGYCAYKLPALGTYETFEIPTFIVITPENGIIIIDVVSEEITNINDDSSVWFSSNDEEGFDSREYISDFYIDELKLRLKKTKKFYDRKKDQYLIDINSYLIFRENSAQDIQTLFSDGVQSNFVSRDDYRNIVNNIFIENIWSSGNVELISELLSYLEGTDVFVKKVKSKKVNKLETVNDFLERSLHKTFKQDSAQRAISMQIPPGPQRIRGLAGTGKTVVLCLKAALTVRRVPDMRILFLFNTQSLYNMIEHLISDYYAKEAKAAIDPESIDVLHAWGGRTTREGLYLQLCDFYKLQPLTFSEVKGSSDPLQRIYKYLLENIGDKFVPIYDMVLIDEAQDFPNEVFEVVYKITKNPKRIVWAYDDFQSLGELRIREPEVMFGFNDKDEPNMSNSELRGEYIGGISKDYILPNCYRNPRIVLMVAHGIALGIYSKDGIVDSVDNIHDWNALGYEVISPKGKDIISAGDEVEVQRPDKYSRNLLENFLTEQKKSSNKLIQINNFEDDKEQCEYVADKIQKLIFEEEVAPEEIFVITLETRKSKEALSDLRIALNQRGVNSITPGFVESASLFNYKGCVTLATPYRAKGNEANVVFVINCQYVTQKYSFKKRNAFFVSVTRSRGWCHISGCGKGMEELKDEVNSIVNDLPNFKYIRPEDDLIQRRRLLLSTPDEELEEKKKLIKKLFKENPELFDSELKEQIDFIDNDD